MEKRSGDEASPAFTTVLFLVLCVGLLCAAECAKAPAMFIFGDSLCDNGNNNFIPSLARANYFPYGIDSDFSIPTGRFSNGLTVPDYAAKYMGLQSPPPYLSLESNSIMLLSGANYASAAAGILDETGHQYGSRIPLREQVKLFDQTVKMQLPVLIPDPEALSHFINSSVFMINIGSNDYINNYLRPDLYNSSATYSGTDFAKLLADELEHQIKIIYKAGARKMLLAGIGPLGCIPDQLARNNITSGCAEEANELARQFNQYLIQTIVRLNDTLPGSSFVYENIYDRFYDIVQHPSKYGFLVSDEACCGHGRYGGQLTCMPFQPACDDRDHYLFWDSFHPTQALNAIISYQCYNGTAGDCFPISGYQLAAM
ncbi:GDSL esterase/lipase 7 [Canna indica]|uniref:GDSL esterase/lipase 7 n=1 Tax=Canna indica TaxID=4628 RepID=A0AAQ3JSW2_9LILI|nr:GDSL esterase/lipase 7 [Canna indica]